MSGRNRVRIIGGAWRSRLVRFPDTAGLRPTPDRVRETLFNWLGQRLDGLAVLDLFAGSGALGFEALSRGARRAVLVERDRKVVEGLRATAHELGASGADIQNADGIAWLSRAAERFDCVFLDPPFASDLAARALEKLPALLNPGALVYAETGGTLAPGSPWVTLREGRAGAVRFALYAIEEREPTPP
jgi:16S rRNA (guanine966-N2)-methyltransferase